MVKLGNWVDLLETTEANKKKNLLHPFDMIQENMLEILKECHQTLFSFLFLQYETH